MDETLRNCEDCGESRPLTDYYKRTRPNGRTEYAKKCKPCMRGHMVKLYWEDPELFRAKSLRNRVAIPAEVRKAQSRAFYAANRERLRVEAQARYQENREAILARDKEYRRRTGRDRKATLRKYGIDEATYDFMLLAQGGGCGICGGPPNGKDPVFHVDHVKGTSRVRGLLCHSCNTSIGHFLHSIPRLESAIAYLRRFGA